MAYKLPNGDIQRNLQEQVLKNKEDILRHFQEAKVMGDFGIRVIDRMDEWRVPTGVFEYGDAIAVGPEGGPFVFYIWTRGNPDYWFNYGAISIVGPEGPPGVQGEKGETGDSTKWYVGNKQPTGPDLKVGDQWLNTNNGSVFSYVQSQAGQYWLLTGNIIGPRGPQGAQGPKGERGPAGEPGPQGKDGNPSPIINIIDKLPEGSIISDIYNPSNVPNNSGVLMPIDGINHLFIIIQGNWTDSGSWGQGGAKILVDGQEVTTFNANTKLDKDTSVTTYNQAYVKAANGGQGTINVTKEALDSAIPQRRTSGALAVPLNTANNDEAASKYYVDRAIAAQHSETPHMTMRFQKPNVTPTRYTIPLGVCGVNIANNYPVRFSGHAYYSLPEMGIYELTFPYGAAMFMITGDAVDKTLNIIIIEAGATLIEMSTNDISIAPDYSAISFTATINNDKPFTDIYLTIDLPPQ